MTPEPATISVVVIGRNEGARLVGCLKSIRGADYPSQRVELIYVDTASTDDSVTQAEALGARVIVIHPDHPTAAAARNAGLRAATHEFVHFFDGDTVVDRAWLEKAVAAMADPGVACVFGRRDEIAPQKTIYNFWAHHDWYVPPGPAESCAGDALFRRSMLERVGGYDETLIAGEEPDLCFRIRHDEGGIVLRLDDPMTKHDIAMTRFGQYWRRCTRTGHAYAEVGGRYRGMRSWRRARWRNLGHVLAVLVAITLSLVVGSVLPLLVWVVLLGFALLRNAVRMRSRVGSLRGAIRYSLHHYLSKVPITIGMTSYWLRTLGRRPPRRLIEYRT